MLKSSSSLLCVAPLLCSAMLAAEEEAESRGPVSLGVTANRGPSTNEGSFLLPVATGVRCISILTQEESVNNKPAGSPYIMVGIPDGLVIGGMAWNT